MEFGSQAVPARATGGNTGRSVVAAVLQHGEDICLLRRSPWVSSDQGLWHCVTGYLGDVGDAESAVRQEVLEETGLECSGYALEGRSRRLRLAGAYGETWFVTAFLFRARTRQLTLNWENDGIRWVRPSFLADLPTVAWLPDVLSAVGLCDGPEQSVLDER